MKRPLWRKGWAWGGSHRGPGVSHDRCMETPATAVIPDLGTNGNHGQEAGKIIAHEVRESKTGMRRQKARSKASHGDKGIELRGWATS